MGAAICFAASTFTFFNLGSSGVGYGTATGGIGALTIDGFTSATGTLTGRFV
jgi:hypothetical protein